MTVHDCPVMIGSDGGHGPAPRAKPVLDGDRRQKRDASGRPQYVPVVEWTDCDMRNRFSLAVIEAVEREHGDNLTQDGP